MQEVHLVCGVPGSGKSWACEQLKDVFHYVSHDAHKSGYAQVLIRAAQSSPRPVLADCPFAERVLKEELEAAGVKVIPYFIVEDPGTVQKRYKERTGKPAPQNVITRAKTIRDRAVEWRAPIGTSDEVLQVLRRAIGRAY